LHHIDLTPRVTVREYGSPLYGSPPSEFFTLTPIDHYLQPLKIGDASPDYRPWAKQQWFLPSLEARVDIRRNITHFKPVFNTTWIFSAAF
jgi:hypothetical protein